MKKSVIFFVKVANKLIRSIASKTHHLQMSLEWGGKDVPEWFDHNIDLFFSWPSTGQPIWIERGVFNLVAIAPGAKILELCCGDGLNSRLFYSNRAASILSVDYDNSALIHARKLNSSPNVDFRKTDLKHEFPLGQFDNIIWDAAISHFTRDEVATILSKIKMSLGETGILSGYTVADNRTGIKQLPHHKFEIVSKEELRDILSEWFEKVVVFETKYPNRHNLYFYASNGVGLPFSAEWQFQATSFKIEK